MSDNPNTLKQHYEELEKFDAQLAEHGKRGIGQAQTWVERNVETIGFRVDAAPSSSTSSHKGKLKHQNGGGWNYETDIARVLLPNTLPDGERVVLDYDTYDHAFYPELPQETIAATAPSKRGIFFWRKPKVILPPPLPIRPELQHEQRPYSVSIVTFPADTDLVNRFPQWSKEHDRELFYAFSGLEPRYSKAWLIDYQAGGAGGGYLKNPGRVTYWTPTPIVEEPLIKEGTILGQQIEINLYHGQVLIRTDIGKGREGNSVRVLYNFEDGQLISQNPQSPQTLDYMKVVTQVMGDLDKTLNEGGI